MKFFKYLILLLSFLFSCNLYAEDFYDAGNYWISNASKTFSTPDAACSAYTKDGKAVQLSKPINYSPSFKQFYYCQSTQGQKYPIYSEFTSTPEVRKCPDSGTPQVVFFDHGSPTPTRICAGSPGYYCSYANPKPDVYNYTKRQMVILRSESSTSTPTCTPTTSNDKCNASDPYGGCYTPPNDGCTRTSNGSIICPPDSPQPDIKKGCTGGASYCERPPQGCGSNYVSGNFNGKAVCVKKGGNAQKPDNNDGGSPPFSGIGPDNGSGDDDGENGGTGNGNNSNTSTSTSTSSSSSSSGSTTVHVTNNNSTTVNIDVSGIIKAVNQVTQTIKQTAYELNTSINEVTRAVNNNGDKITNAVNTNGKNTVDSINVNGDKVTNAVNTNGKNTVDAVNAGTEATKENGKKLDAVKKSVDDGNGILKDIKDWLTKEPPKQEDSQIPKKELEKKSFNENIIALSAPACPPDWQLNWSTPFGTIDKTISYQDLCSSSSWLGYLFLAISYVIGARIVMGDS